MKISVYLTLILVLASSVVGAEREKMNVLWLIAEDTGPSAYSCYGEQLAAHTPNIDKLAAGGVRYDRFYTTSPVCSTARSAFNTGMYQTSIGAHQHRTAILEPLPDGVYTLNEILQKAGYYTANLKTLPETAGFSLYGKTDWNFLTKDIQDFESSDWEEMVRHEPFYAQINFDETHRTFNNTGETNRDEVVLPPYYPEHPVIREDYAAYLDSARELDKKVGKVLKLLEDEGLADRTLVIFMGDNGEAQIRGKQFCYEEGLRVPMIIRWPDDIAKPAHYRAGSFDDRLLEAIDVAPTLLSLFGQAIPEKMEGCPFLGDAAGDPKEYVFGARDRCDETPMRLRSVRSDRYRYIKNFTPEQAFFTPNAYKKCQYPAWTLIPELMKEGKLNAVQARLCWKSEPEEMLFDMRADPHQLINLVDSTMPEHQEALVRLRSELDSWIERTGDQGAIPETMTPEEAMERVRNR